MGVCGDLESLNIRLSSVSFVEDATMGDDKSTPHETQLVKTLLIQDSETET